MTVKEIAELCGVEDRTVRNWCHGERFLKENFSLRNAIVEKLSNGSPEVPADFSLEETLAIIRDGGKNETLAALLEKERNLTTALQGTVESSLLPLNFKGCAVRTVMIGNMPWFVAKDVCEVLELSDVSMSVAKLDDGEKLVQKLFVSGQNRDMIIVNESGLYTLIMRSNKPEAWSFRKWVTSEVLPSIRATGQYTMPQLVENRLAAMEKMLVDNASRGEEIIKELAVMKDQFETMDVLQRDQLFEIQQEIDGLKGVKEVVSDLNAARKEVKEKDRYFQLDEDIATFFKNHIATDVLPMTCTKVIDLWDLFHYDYDNKYKKAEFLERFKMLYPQFTLFKGKNVYLFQQINDSQRL
uniref:BRO family protein n=1 Tax=uncultured Treponema sp. TaxID=162155 RepID=UPI0028EE0FF3